MDKYEQTDMDRLASRPVLPPFRLMVTDFDGTIHTEEEHPPIAEPFQEQVAALQAQGILWMINTGRDLPGIIEALARAHCRVKPDFLGVVEREIYALENGRYVGWSDWNQQCARDQAEVFAHLQPHVPAMVKWVRAHFSATVYSDAWSPLCVIAENNHDADHILAHFESYCQQVPGLAIVRNDVYARFSHAAYHKGSVLAEVARRLHFAPDEVLAAGDHWNDLPMLDRQYARWLVAPANAVASVKTAVEEQGGYVADGAWGHGVSEGIAAAWTVGAETE